MYIDDTIAAISTPAGTGGISIIRISGKDAVEIADKVFCGGRKSLKSVKTHTINHGYIKRNDGTVIDEVLVSVMIAPNSYTKENIVEINCHGGIISTKEILSVVLENGARLAEAGEFTKRAFMNGRMDLCEAESVIDIINSHNNTAHRVSVNQLRGSLSKSIDEIREKLLALTSHLQVLIDFADEDLEPLTDEEYRNGLESADLDVKKLLSTSLKGKIIKEGIKTAIAGKPNVGKSSLLNLLYGEERAIVTDIEGTTRDAIEESVMLGDLVLKIADTAGIRETGDTVESIGVEKAKSILKDADLVIYMTDASMELDENDRYIIDAVKDKNVIALVNKAENGVRTNVDEIKESIEDVILFSVKEKTGIDELKTAVERMFESGDVANSDEAIITNIRHEEALKKADAALKSALDAIDTGIPLNMTFIDVENAIAALGEITGQTVGEEIVDRIFHRFCVGK